MAVKCPNISHPDWELSVRLFGLDHTLYYYDALGEVVPNKYQLAQLFKQRKGDELNEFNNPEVWDIEASEDLIARWRTTAQGRHIPVKRAFTNYKASALIKQFRNKYPEATFSTFKFETPSKANTRIRVSVAFDTIEPTGEYAQREDTTIREPLNEEERKDFDRKKAIMLDTFPWITEVIEDEKLVNLGQLEKNGTVIRVNPVKMSKDTIGHEFGHLLIDIIGGLENPLVKSALKQLKDTPLAKRIRDAYSDKTETVINKEIVAEAIGLKTDEIFEEEEARSNWEKWLLRFYNRIKRLLGIETNAVKKLARMVLGSEEFKVTAEVQEAIYEQKEEEADKTPKYLNKLHEEIGILEATKTEILDRLRTKVQIYERSEKVKGVEALKERIDRIEFNMSPLKSIVEFLDLASSQVSRIHRTYTKAKAKFDAGDKEAINARDLQKWADYVSAFDLVESIELSLIDRIGRENYNSRRFDGTRQLIQDTISKKNEIKSFLKKEGEDIIVDWLEPYVTRIASEYRLRFERKWRKLPRKEKEAVSMQEYIEKNVADNEELIKNKTRLVIKSELQKGEFDIGYGSRIAETILDSDDVVVSAMVKAFAAAMDRSRRKGLDKRDEIIDKLRKLEQFTPQSGFVAPEKFYEFLLEKDAKGRYLNVLVGEYKSAFWEAHAANKEQAAAARDLRREEIRNKDIPASEKHAFLDAAETAYWNELSTWNNENAPLNLEAFNAAKMEYISSLVDDGVISEGEYEDILSNIQYKLYQPLSTVLGENLEAIDSVNRWSSENTWNFREPLKKWESEQYKELMKLKEDDPRREFFELIRSISEEGDDIIPYRYRLKQYLPYMPKSYVERVQAGQGLYNSSKAAMADSFAVRIFDVEKGQLDEDRRTLELTDENDNPKLFLPVHYSPGKGKTEAERAEILETQSFDIASIYYNWYKMAVEYGEKNAILPEMELTKHLIENRRVTKLDSKSNPIINANEKLRNKELTKTGMQSLIAAQLNDWFEAVVYGKRTKDEGTFTILGKEFDKAKTFDKLNAYTAYNLLGFNLVQGVANAALGETMQIAEALAKEHYTMKDYHKASRIYAKNLFGIVGDIGSRQPINIVNLIMERFDILHDYGAPDKFRKSSKFRQLMQSDTIFFMARAGEHEMQARAAIAILNNLNAVNKEGKPILDEKGKPVSIFDSLEVKDNKLVVKEGVSLSDEQIDVIGHKIKRLLSRMHGEYSDLGRVALQRTALGRLAYMFRKFMVQGWKRRMETSKRLNEDGTKAFKYNELGEFFTEGAYRTTGKFMINFARDWNKFSLEVARQNSRGLTTMERANIRRTVTEMIAWGLISWGSTVLLTMKGETDDDDAKLALSHAAYQLLRLKSELAFFVNPMEAAKILRSPAASMSVIENVGKMISLFNPFAPKLGERFERGGWEGHYKWEKYLTNAFPVIRQVPKITDIENQLNWFK